MLGKNNFIGFNKYDISGAYHWDALNINEEYISQSNIIINEAINLKPSFLLDIGCGDGAIAGKLGMLLPESNIYGFDAEPTAVSCATKKLSQYNITNVTINNCNIEEAVSLYKYKNFDFIFSLDVIEHLPNPFELINFIKIFNPKNAIIGSPLFSGEEYMSPYHIKEYTKDELISMIGKENILQEWILGGKRKSKVNHNKRFFEKNYYICKVCFN